MTGAASSPGGELQEARRQQLLLAAVQSQGRVPDELARLGCRLPGPRGQATPGDGLAAYRRHAAALAPRALEAVYPVLAEVMGAASWRGLARWHWQHCPPGCGDLGEWGGGLAAALDALPAGGTSLPPYLADLARLEWALHQAARAPRHEGPAEGLAWLASAPPEALRLVLRPGCRLLVSRWPVGTIWHAHQGPSADRPDEATGQGDDDPRFARAREALAEGRGESVWVWREGWRARAAVMAADEAGFTAALARGLTLAEAWEASPPADFQDWLMRALREGWLIRIERRA